jgi:hypothetical protein
MVATVTDSEVQSVPLVQVAKAKRGRGATVARWMIGVLREGEDSDHPTIILEDKYISPESALRAIETKGIENAKYIVREIVAETKVTARLV